MVGAFLLASTFGLNYFCRGGRAVFSPIQNGLMHFVNFSEFLDAKWRFVEPINSDPDLSWEFHTPSRKAHGWGLKANVWSAASGAVAGLRARPDSVLVSHLPGATFRAELPRKLRAARHRHIAFAFNFTTLPAGWRRKIFARVLRGVDEIVVFTALERELYARHFDLPQERFRYLPYCTAPPPVDPDVVLPFERPYLVAVGGEGRDYHSLMRAARMRPDLRLVVIARPHNLSDLAVPPNVAVFVNLSEAETWGLARKSAGMLLPLNSDQAANGHVTLVGAQLLGIPLAITDSRGVRDYVSADDSLLVPAGDANGLAEAMDHLASAGAGQQAMADLARNRAIIRSDPLNWVAYFSDYAARRLATTVAPRAV